MRGKWDLVLWSCAHCWPHVALGVGSGNRASRARVNGWNLSYASDAG